MNNVCVAGSIDMDVVARHRFADRLGVDCGVLAAFDIGLNIRECHQEHVVPHRPEGAEKLHG